MMARPRPSRDKGNHYRADTSTNRPGRPRVAAAYSAIEEIRMVDEVGIARRSPYALALLRIVAGLILLEHGTQKFLSFPAGKAAGSGWALDNPGAFAGIVELIAGALLVLGLFTRSAAFLASGMTAVAYWYAHAPQNFFPVNNGGDAAILYCFVFLYLVFAGPGAWSIDGVRARSGSSEVGPARA
jgi:putative oxidoreductase